MAAALATAVVVDDDPNVRHMLVQVFEAAGFSTIAVGSGSEGVRAVLAMRPLITSLDVTMPGVDGIEATRLIRAAGADTHIMMITASREETDVVLGLSAGADEYVYKPLRVRELRARIDAVLRRATDAMDAPAELDPNAAVAPLVHVEPAHVAPTHVAAAAPAWPASAQPMPEQPRPASWTPEPASGGTTHIEFGQGTPDWAPAHVTPDWEPPRHVFAQAEPAPYSHANALMNQQIGAPAHPMTPAPPAIPAPPATAAPSTTPEPSVTPDIPAFLVHADLIVDPSRRIVQLGGRTIALDGVELTLLTTLMQSKGLTRSKAELAVLLRGGPTTPKPRIPAHEKAVIDNHIASLRRKIGDDGGRARYIEPVEPIGYRMVTDG